MDDDTKKLESAASQSELAPEPDLPDAPPELQRQVLREMRSSFLREYQGLRVQAAVHRDIGNTRAVEEITKSMETGRRALAAIDLRLGLLGNVGAAKG